MITDRWSFAEATALRATAFVHLILMSIGLFAPASLFPSWGLPFAEPATFLRWSMVIYGALGIALLRASRLSRSAGRLLVETVALVKLAFVLVVMTDILAQKLPGRAWIAVILDLVFGLVLYRAARRVIPPSSASPA
jgi:hypothetical protein